MDAAPRTPYALPASFEHGTIFVEPVAQTGQRLHFYTDTGGGDWMYHAAAVDLGWRPPDASDGDEWTPVTLPQFRDDAWIPSPLSDGLIMVNPGAEDQSGGRPPVGRSGMLGQQWFGNRIWEIDYPAARLVLHQTPPTDKYDATVPLAFKATEHRRALNFPRIQATVDGELLDLLLDTGAHTNLTPDAATRMNSDAPVQAASFIIGSIARRWRARHPDWPVIESGEGWSGFDMIQVPTVQVGGLETGPVWFTQRPEKSFLEYMSQWMDKAIVGALGGNALRTFRLLLDYPAATVSLNSGKH